MSDHVETLKKVRKLLQNTPALQGREHVGLGIAFNNAIDHFDAPPTRNVELIAEIRRLMGRRSAIGGTPEIAEMYREGCSDFIHRYDAMLIAALAGVAVTEDEILALIAGPHNYHHKMDEHAEREADAFNRCRELTIQNVRTFFAMRNAMEQKP